MKPTWSVVAVAAVLGGIAGATLLWAFGDVSPEASRRGDSVPPDTWDSRRTVEPGPADGEGWRPLPPSEDPALRPGLPRDARPQIPAGTAVPGTPEAEADAADAATKAAAERRRREVADRVQLPDGAEIARRLADARSVRDRDGFARALRAACESFDVAAHDALAVLIADPEFSFPDGHDAVRVGTSKALLVSKSPNLAAAAKARYSRERARPGDSWDAHGWLALVAARGTADDIAWIESQYAAAPRPAQVTESLGFASDELAVAAIRRAIMADPPREGWPDAIEQLSTRSPGAAFSVLDETVARSIASAKPDAADWADLGGLWVKTAGKAHRARVLERIAATRDLDWQIALLPVVQALTASDGTTPTALTAPGVAEVISAPGRALRALGAAELSPFEQLDALRYSEAIEQNRVAWTPENIAALEHAAGRLDKDFADELRSVIDLVRRNAAWK